MATGIVFTDLQKKKKFDAMYNGATAMDKSDTQLVTLCYTMLDMLVGVDGAYKAKVNPLHMGIHPRNRGGKKMPDSKVHTKGSKVIKVGFNLKLCGPEKAIGFEDNPKTKHIEKHTMATTAGNQYFAQYPAGSIRAGSVGCSHLNQYLAAGVYGAKTHFPDDKICEDGTDVMSKKQMLLINDDIDDAMTGGLTWTIVKWSIEESYPLLPEIFQRALNIEHHIGEGTCFFLLCILVSIYLI